ncbi:MAG: hypothetical protein RLZ92_1717 [Pseudomonadota bacterium]|jgi:hypothetical protein
MKSSRIVWLLMAVLFAGCGKEAKPQKVLKESIQKYEKVVTLQGSVSNNSGLVKSGKIEARLPSGELLAETVLENSARYQLQIPAGTVLPLILSFSPTDASQNADKLISVVVQADINRYDISPLTTAIAQQAKALGGYTLRNMSQAAEDGVHVPDANKTSTGFRGDPTKQYGGWH